MKIALRKMTESAQIPVRGSLQAAGYDLFADLSEAVTILPQETKMVGTGIACAIPEGFFGGIYARSGLSAKEGLRPANCTGVVDSDYRGEIKVALHNDSKESRTILPGQKIAQMVVQAFLPVVFETVEDLDATERGGGGFGSTGKL